MTASVVAVCRDTADKRTTPTGRVNEFSALMPAGRLKHERPFHCALAREREVTATGEANVLETVPAALGMTYLGHLPT